MSVEVVQGDLTDWLAGITVLAHQANCQNTMQSGVALAIKRKHPEAYAADTEAFKRGDARLGCFSTALLPDGKRIVNLYGQERYGQNRRHTDYEALYTCLSLLRDVLEEAHEAGRVYVLGLPHKIGCGTGGGDWRIVSSMIGALFEASPVRVVIVQLPPPPAPASAPKIETAISAAEFEAICGKLHGKPLGGTETRDPWDIS